MLDEISWISCFWSTGTRNSSTGVDNRFGESKTEIFQICSWVAAISTQSSIRKEKKKKTTKQIYRKWQPSPLNLDPRSLSIAKMLCPRSSPWNIPTFESLPARHRPTHLQQCLRPTATKQDWWRTEWESWEPTAQLLESPSICKQTSSGKN